MSIGYRCEACRNRFEVPADRAGASPRCPRCGGAVTTSEAGSPAKTASRSGLREDSRVQGPAVVLLVLSAADLFMTYTLLRTSPRFFESNPIAQFFFGRWNIAGMAIFKFGVVAIIIVLGEFIERHRPGWGRVVLLLGSVAAGYAVYKGLNLYLNHAPPPVVVE